MRKINHLFVISAACLCVMTAGAAQAALPPQTLTLPPDGQFHLPVSNTNPNLIAVPGDRITAISSAGGTLADKHNTPAGAVLFASTSDKPFTLYLETEHGQMFTVQATPRKGEGQSYQLTGTQPVARPEAKRWETGEPYESMLVDLNKAALAHRLPDSYAPADVTSDRRVAPSDLVMSAEEAWTGNALRLVRYRVSNPTGRTVTLKEQDFWHTGIRAVMFSPQTPTLLPGASVTLFITATQEVKDGQP